MWTRRQFLARGTALTGLAVAANGILALDRDKMPDGSASRGMITSATEKAINAGLDYLANAQHADGSFGTSDRKGSVAITSLAALALISGGHQPGRGKYGDRVTRALSYVLTQKTMIRDGRGDVGEYLASADRFRNFFAERMYGHGFATLFLGEVYGMVHNPELHRKLRATLRSAIGLILKTQNDQGGWRYEPRRSEADLSVTICQIMALRSARNAGLAVPRSTVTNCIEYVMACQNYTPRGQANQGGFMPAGGDGGFKYMKGFPGASGFARTAAGVVALYSAGVYKNPRIEAGLDYLMRYKPGTRVQNFNNPLHEREMQVYYFYAHYYAAQAMWTAGGKYWQQWYPAIRDELLTRTDHRRDGYWYDIICPHYATAMALIILQIPNNYLPILQK